MREVAQSFCQVVDILPGCDHGTFSARFSKSVQELHMLVKKVTSVMFGGANLDILYVTSMAKPPLPRFPDDGPLRGALFAIYDLGVRGVPEARFGG